MSIANRDNMRLVWCHTCPHGGTIQRLWKGKLSAHMKAQKHARQNPSHEVVVIDLVRLEVEHRYQFDALPDLSEPPF